MFQCSYHLNDKPLSDFVVAGNRFPAFSGLGGSVNKRAAACHVGVGPIPPGQYWILDREKGGLMSQARARFATPKDHWFALYRDDGKIDDKMMCDAIERGNFRLHPNGRGGISQGCITIKAESDFQRLAALLRSLAPVAIGGSTVKAFGLVTVS